MDTKFSLKFERSKKWQVSRVKVMMTTALGDSGNIMKAFGSQCDAYLTKPIFREKLEEQLENIGLAQRVRGA